MSGRFVAAQISGCSNLKEAYDKIVLYTKKAKAEHQADLILFPETVDRWGRFSDAQTLDDEFVRNIRILAKNEHIWIVTGMREKSDEKLYNTVLMIDSEGKLVRTYHKTHLYDAFGTMESEEYKPGEQLFEPLDTPLGKLGLFVCYEARFPEIARKQALKGAQILLMPTAWIKGKRKEEQLQILSQARALENNCYLLLANLCDEHCTGKSCIIDPLGEILSQADHEEVLLFQEIDTAQIKKIRANVPSLKNRREELY